MINAQFGGASLIDHEPVRAVLARRFPVTLELALLAFVIGWLIAMPLGVLAAYYHNRWPYVLAARVLGASPARVALRHVVPNSLAPVVAIAANLMGAAVVAEAGLSFLGLGVPPPAPSWGSVLNEASRGGNFKNSLAAGDLPVHGAGGTGVQFHVHRRWSARRARPAATHMTVTPAVRSRL
jgi:hypothetical protein